MTISGGVRCGCSEITATDRGTIGSTDRAAHCGGDRVTVATIKLDWTAKATVGPARLLLSLLLVRTTPRHYRLGRVTVATISSNGPPKPL